MKRIIVEGGLVGAVIRDQDGSVVFRFAPEGRVYCAPGEHTEAIARAFVDKTPVHAVIEVGEVGDVEAKPAHDALLDDFKDAIGRLEKMRVERDALQAALDKKTRDHATACDTIASLGAGLDRHRADATASNTALDDVERACKSRDHAKNVLAGVLAFCDVAVRDANRILDESSVGALGHATAVGQRTIAEDVVRFIRSRQ